MKITRVYLMLLGIVTLLFSGEKAVLHFAPLPMKKEQRVIQEYLSFLTFSESILPVTFQLHYYNHYASILDGFITGEVDMALLGPLPLKLLKKRYSWSKPIALVGQKNGKPTYRCALSKFAKDRVPSQRRFKVALTQPQSTCGYLMTDVLLKKHFGVALGTQYYRYTHSHSNAIEQTLQGKFDIAGSSEPIAKQYDSLGMEVIAVSELLPGFALVLNRKTVPEALQREIEKKLLSIPAKKWQEVGGITKNGLFEVDMRLYDTLSIDIEIPVTDQVPQGITP